MTPREEEEEQEEEEKEGMGEQVDQGGTAHLPLST